MPRGARLAVRAHLASDGLAAGGADAGRCGHDAQLLQVPREAVQHVVQ